MPQPTKPAGADKQDLTSVRAAVVSLQATAASGAIPAESLFKGGQAVRILHKGDLYHLRITRNDKLILTK
jgi:hemin uptake protein HemP